MATLALGLEDLQHVLPYLARLLGGIDALPDAGLLVVADHGGRLGVVGCKALLQSIGVVVAALNKRLARHVVLHVVLRGVKGAVVAATGCRVDQTAGDTGDQQGVVDLQLDGVLELLVALREHRVEALGLHDGAGEAIEDEPGQKSAALLVGHGQGWEHIPSLALLIVVELLLDHANDNLIADETALVHDLLGLAAEGSLLRNLRSQHVTGGLRNNRQQRPRTVCSASKKTEWSIDIPGGSRRTSP